MPNSVRPHRQKPTQVGCQVKWRQRPISQEIAMIANEPPEARRIGWRKFCLTALRRNQHWQPSESWLPGSREWDITQIMMLCYDILGKLTQWLKSLGGRHNSQWLWKAGTQQEAAKGRPRPPLSLKAGWASFRVAWFLALRMLMQRWPSAQDDIGAIPASAVTQDGSSPRFPPVVKILLF